MDEDDDDDVGRNGLDDTFEKGMDEGSGYAYVGQSAAWGRAPTPRSGSPAETSSSVYAERFNALSQSPPPTNYGDALSGPEDDGITDSDVERAEAEAKAVAYAMSDAYAMSVHKDRRQAKTKRDQPREYRLGAIGRSRGGESRKKPRLPEKSVEGGGEASEGRAQLLL